jgi:hypothetical protein
MDNFNSSEIKYKFQPFGKYYYESQIFPRVEVYIPEIVNVFFIQFFRKVKDADVKQALKNLERGFYGSVFAYLDNSEHYVLKEINNRRKIKKEDQTHLLTIGLYADFKREFHKVMDANSGGLYEIEEMM